MRVGGVGEREEIVQSLADGKTIGPYELLAEVLEILLDYPAGLSRSHDPILNPYNGRGG